MKEAIEEAAHQRLKAHCGQHDHDHHKKAIPADRLFFPPAGRLSHPAILRQRA